MTPLHTLTKLGQSVWLDSISREMLDSGELGALVDSRAISGVTSNPSIFQKALAGGSSYDADIESLAARGLSDREIFTQLAVDDIQRACDALRPVWVATGKQDGMVSLEVEPDLATDTDATVARARELWELVERPNLFIKVPATPAGLPAIEELLASGIHVNVTLLFSVRVYRQVIERYMRALERRREAGLDANVQSVASFFVSRVDTAVDPLLSEAGPSGERLAGTIAVANARAAWGAYLAAFTSDRFVRELRVWGATPQRPLWASTSTKNPDYSDLLYVEPLIVSGSVNTMPADTVEAFADHGTAKLGIDDAAVKDAHARLGELRELGIDLDRVTDELLDAGVEAFADSYATLLSGIRKRRAELVS